MKTFIVLALLVVCAVAYPMPDEPDVNAQNALPGEPKADEVGERFGGFGHHGHHGGYGHHRPGGYYPGGNLNSESHWVCYNSENLSLVW